MLNDLNMWNKIGRIVTRLSERLEVSTERALDLFYNSKTCRNLHDSSMGLYLLADNCIVEDVLAELRGE